MGLLTTTDDKTLEEGRKRVTVGEMVCPACKAPFTRSGATLVAWNPVIGLEGHKCPACGQVATVATPSPDGL
jgi:hypothetical protein